MDDKLIEIIKEHEGFSTYAYADSLGFLTIGYGKMIDRKKNGGITQEEAQYLLQNDVNKAQSELNNFAWFTQLDSVRAGVFIELCFNIGLTSLLKFYQTIQAVQSKDYDAAAMHLLNSLWAKQVKEGRADNMAKRLKTGSYEA